MEFSRSSPKGVERIRALFQRFHGAELQKERICKQTTRTKDSQSLGLMEKLLGCFFSPLFLFTQREKKALGKLPPQRFQPKQATLWCHMRTEEWELQRGDKIPFSHPFPKLSYLRSLRITRIPWQEVPVPRRGSQCCHRRSRAQGRDEQGNLGEASPSPSSH